MIFLCYPKCTTCQKAKKWLDDKGVEYTLRNIKEENPTSDELKEWYAKSSKELKKFFNTSGLLYKSMELKNKLPDMSEEEMLLLLATDGMLCEAAEKLLENPYVNGATVNNYKKVSEPPVATSDETLLPATPEETMPDLKESDWYPGVVIVVLKHNAPSVEELLESVEVEEVSVIIADLGYGELLYVTLSEKTESSVSKAIKELGTSSYVVSAAPDYIHDWGESQGDDVYWIAKRGDTNSDGKIDIKDATTIQKWLVGILAIDLVNDIGDDYISSSTVGDFDYDGKITIKDATAIQKSIAGIN